MKQEPELNGNTSLSTATAVNPPPQESAIDPPQPQLNPEDLLQKFLQQLVENLKPRPKTIIKIEEEVTIEDDENQVKKLNQQDFEFLDKLSKDFMKMLEIQADQAEKNEYPNRILNGNERTTLQEKIIQPLLTQIGNKFNPAKAGQRPNEDPGEKVDSSFANYAKDVINDSVGTEGFNNLAKGLGIDPQKMTPLNEKISSAIAGGLNFSLSPVNISAGPSFRGKK